MARKVLVRLVDDLDGLPSEDVATVTFSLDRVTYQIDLNAANASKLRDGMAEFVTAARRTGGRVKRGTGVRAAGAGNDGPAIREWAREQGHQLAERGRIPSHIVDAFRASRGGRVKAGVTATAEVAPAKPARASRKAAAAPARGATVKTAAASRTAAKATAKTTTAKTAKAAPAKAATPAKTAKTTKAGSAKTAKTPRTAASTSGRGQRTRRAAAPKSR